MYPGGLWYNELGSWMNINVSGSSVWGIYYSRVGQATNTYEVAGRADSDPYTYSQSLAWTVAWKNLHNNAHSVTSWSGQYQVNEGQEEIVALWLLTSEQQEQDDWRSTLVGQDIFTRRAPSGDQVQANRRRLGSSEPELDK
jgi:hypothetical protein